MTTTDESSLQVRDVEDLLFDAFALIERRLGKQNDDEVRAWRTRARNFIELLLGSSHALEVAVRQAIGEASTCWERPSDAGEYLKDEADRIADELIERIGEYADKLPLIRPYATVQLEDHESVGVTIARAIYDISAQVGGGVSSQEKWDTAPSAIKVVLLETTNQLIGSGVITPGPALDQVKQELTEYPLKTTNVSDDIPQSLREQVAKTMSDMGFSLITDPQSEPTPRFYRKFCRPNCNRENDHDGREPGACQRDGVAIGQLPPNIPTPPGFHPGK